LFVIESAKVTISEKKKRLEGDFPSGLFKIIDKAVFRIP
jgi:hypothetical protein